MPQKRATIYEVAAMAGVSHQTVSRYLRDTGGLKPATVTKVRTAIEELNYRPNLIARSMRTRRTGRIAILLPATPTSLPLRLMSAAATTAHAAGYAIDILGLEGSGTDRVARAQELADSGEFEGILALAAVKDEPARTRPRRSSSSLTTTTSCVASVPSQTVPRAGRSCSGWSRSVTPTSCTWRAHRTTPPR